MQQCFHCGDKCREDTIIAHEKLFCCEGCKLVYEILDENNLCNYYQLNNTPGSQEQKRTNSARYEFLEDEKIRQQLISFTNGNITDVTFLIPQIHCSSCIWLLEHLYKLDKGIKRATVNFLKREVHLVFSDQETSLKKIAELLNRIGYAPHISLDNSKDTKKLTSHKTSYYKLGVAFFCFGNIMLLSFPEYFGLSDVLEKDFRILFGYLNIFLSLPVLLYADMDFFKSAIAGLRQKRLNMDFPISLGIVVMYARSLFEILSGTGAGYMDTFAALVFFMLAGRMFQNKSYERLSFERDYKSYFPIAITVIEGGKQVSKAVSEVSRGHRILIRNEELIPADSILLKGVANIDYSFVTGENIPVLKKPGEKIYAGGKQLGAAIELEVVNEVSQSRLTQLWNECDYGQNKENKLSSVVDKVSIYFSIIVLLIAMGAGIFYMAQGNNPKALNAFTAVLIITCPCALALSYPFALGNTIRILGNSGLYLKNTGVIEKLSHITSIVFDKTGTLTKSGSAQIKFYGDTLSNHDLSLIFTLVSQSAHPLSRLLATELETQTRVKIDNFKEITGAGIEGIIEGIPVRLGSAAFAGKVIPPDGHINNNAEVHVSIGDQYKGFYDISTKYRDGLKETLSTLADSYDLQLLSGDNSAERKKLSVYFSDNEKMHFEQSPSDKLNFIRNLQHNKNKVMMLGDGLNDAGALMQSYTGIAVTDNVNNFTPACDGILDASRFYKIPAFLKFSKSSMKIIFASYIISFLYNIAGTWWAVQGNLSPVFAAIIMPLSTITIILFTTVSSNIAARIHNVKS